jgi:hypothetical protein
MYPTPLYILEDENDTELQDLMHSTEVATFEVMK